MADRKLTFDEFVEAATESAIRATRRQVELGQLKWPPKIWVGIIIDQISEVGFSAPGKTVTPGK